MQNENGSPKKSLLSAQVDLSKFDSSYFRAATEEEKKQQDVMSESTTFFKDGIRRLKKEPVGNGKSGSADLNIVNYYHSTTHCALQL